MSERPAFADVARAAEQIAPYVHRTPVLTSRLLDEVAGVSCFFKCENFQRGGSFKMRGAAYFLSSLSDQDRKRGVVAFSSGNHGQAVAIAAKDFGVPATIVMPRTAPKAKIESTRAQGATIVLYDPATENREQVARDIAARRVAALVPPFDHYWTITGQATVALELMEEIDGLDTIVTPLGGGGLLSGTAISATALNSHARVYGVEPEVANDWALSMAANERVAIDLPPTIADGLRSPQPGELTFPIVRELSEGVLLVSEEEIRKTIRLFLSRMKIVVEPSGAVAAAAVLHRRIPQGSRRVGVILTGGNIDFDLLASICVE